MPNTPRSIDYRHPPAFTFILILAIQSRLIMNEILIKFHMKTSYKYVAGIQGHELSHVQHYSFSYFV